MKEEVVCETILAVAENNRSFALYLTSSNLYIAKISIGERATISFARSEGITAEDMREIIRFMEEKLALRNL